MEIYRGLLEKLLILIETFLEIFSHNLEKITKFYPMCISITLDFIKELLFVIKLR